LGDRVVGTSVVARTDEGVGAVDAGIEAGFVVRVDSPAPPRPPILMVKASKASAALWCMF